MPASAFQLISIEISGSKRFSAKDVIAATGLKIGQTAHEDDFKGAAERLGESGAFTQVGYHFDYSADGTKLQFQVVDAIKFVPVTFDNLVWFSDAELQQKLRASVPLYQGELPLSGTLPDQVDEVLQAMIAEKGIPAEVDYLRAAKANAPISSYVFSVSGPEIQIRKVSFSGVPPAEQELLESAAHEMPGETYQRGALEAQSTFDLMPVLLGSGYLKAKISGPQPTVVQQDGPQVTVDVAFSVTSGPQYRLAGLQWAGNKVFPAEKLATLVNMPEGKPANAVLLAKQLRAVHQLYETRGYMAAAVTPEPSFDDANSTVRYVLDVHEGDQYRMGEIDIGGLESNATDRLLTAWTLKNGQPYNSEYLKQYLAGTFKLLPPGNWKTTVHQTLNQDKTVDITLRFDLKGPELQ